MKNHRLCQYCFENRIYDDRMPMCMTCMEEQIEERKKPKIFVPKKGRATVNRMMVNKAPKPLYEWIYAKPAPLMVRGKKVPMGPPAQLFKQEESPC